METITQKLENFQIKYPLEQIAPLESVLFLDIETTGFTANSSSLYMIGTAYYKEGAWYITQFFAHSPVEETAILSSFFQMALQYKYLIHFNGNHFDLPYLCKKCETLGLPYNFDSFLGIDIYKRVSPIKFFLKLPNCKQKTIESFLEINREDTFNGGELIGIYQDYVSAPTDISRDILLRHNFDDMQGMLQILPILSYSDLFDKKVKVKKVQANHYKDYTGKNRQEILMTLTLPSPLPKRISASANECYFSGEGYDASIKVPVYEEELKYFYANYKDYYYLPTEDVALHKSVASFVDKEHRTPASAANCYTRKFSLYLPQWDIVTEPFFKRDYKSKVLFFELTEELKRDRTTFTRYASHILEMISTSY
ncbi:MAG: ribonuclease H-like domain-containing protein [Lachnospiraceae bacterium]|nr:ribonuclease H-like domain-containing protein [Lachnospiraceae bacterium]